MTFNKIQTSKSRKRAMAGVIFLVGILLVWQFGSMFGKTPVANPKAKGATGVAVAQQTPPPAVVEPTKPKPAEVPVAVPMTDREKALMVLQQETQIKYLEALNELQLLKVNKQIADVDKDISAARLGKVEADKKIVDLLTGGVGVAGAAPAAATTTTTTTTATSGILQDVTYSVVSISQVQFRWAAVLSYKGALYNVHVGDVLPLDNSTVVAISKDSVTLQKEGVRKKLSLVSII